MILTKATSHILAGALAVLVGSDKSNIIPSECPGGIF